MISIAIIEDHQMLIDALSVMLSSSSEFSFAGSANNLNDGLALIERTQPDVLLLDVGLPDGDGLDVLPEVKRRFPHTQVVILTSMTDEDVLVRALDSGVSGFVSKSGALADLFSSIRKAAQGEIVVPPSLLLGLLKRLPHGKVSSDEEHVWEELTAREHEILELLARGRSGADIAKALNIAPLTVRTHVRNIMAKLGVHSRLEAVAFAQKHGIFPAKGKGKPNAK